MWPCVNGKRINTPHISNDIHLVMMNRASQVMSTSDHKYVDKWLGETVMITLADLLCSKQAQSNISYSISSELFVNHWLGSSWPKSYI